LESLADFQCFGRKFREFHNAGHRVLFPRLSVAKG
jgi:hypothetical protein